MIAGTAAPRLPTARTPHSVVRRVCMPTWRRFNQGAFQCGLYEAQDVLAECEDVDLVELEARSGLRRKETLQKLLLYRDPTNTLMFANPGLRRVSVNSRYELFVVVCQNYADLLYLNALDGWRKRCRTSVCWIDELWAASVPRYRNWLKALDQFDHICVGSLGTVPVLSAAIGRQCHWMPGGVDALRFSPYPDPPERVVDVYSIGRRWEGIHSALLQRSAAREIFYIHDTLQDVSSARPYDNAQHRSMYANIAKRSRYFIVAPAKMNLPSDTEGQVELGYRYFEGAATGAILLGQAPNTESYQRLFGWPEAVTDIRPDGSDVLATIGSLDADPHRANQLRQRTAVESLRRHDWIYRWLELYRIAGVEPSPAMLQRAEHLKTLAATALARLA